MLGWSIPYMSLFHLSYTHTHTLRHHNFVLCQAVGKLLAEVSAYEAALPQLP